MIGIDEVGRGSWAGPLLVAAVDLCINLEGLTDSKKLSATERERLARVIALQTQIGFGWVSSAEIDAIGLSKALILGAQRSISQLNYGQKIIIDGTVNLLPNHQHATTMKQADLLIPAVSAASIVAKVARDNYMKILDRKYPHYGFASHVGYGTKMHSAALKSYGPSPIHRFSYAPVRATIPT